MAINRPGVVLVSLGLMAAACSGSTPATPTSAPTPSTTSLVAPTPTTSTTTAPPTTLAVTTTPTPTSAAPPPPCEIGLPPPDLAADPFYEKHCEVLGLAILSSGAVDDGALLAAADLVLGMIGHRRDLVDVMVANGLRIAAIGSAEVTTDLPEYRDFNELFPAVDWDGATRGIGATMAIPLASGAEENLRCLDDDVYAGENILVKALANSIRDLGLATSNPGANLAVDESYEIAVAIGLWEDTFAATSAGQYWSEGVQGYFNTNLESEEANGIHNFVNTREELAEYDPDLFVLIDAVFSGTEWLPTCAF